MPDRRLNPTRVLRALHAAFCHDAPQQELLEIAVTKTVDGESEFAGGSIYLFQNESLTQKATSGPAVAAQPEAGRLEALMVALQEGETLRHESDLLVPICLGEKRFGVMEVLSFGDRPPGDRASTAVGEVAAGLATLL